MASQALVHGVKGLRELAGSRDPSPRDQVVTETLWRDRADRLLAFIEAKNPVLRNLANDGSVETVLAQVKRGDSHADARQRCWEHISIEMKNLPCWEFIVSGGPEKIPQESERGPSMTAPTMEETLSLVLDEAGTPTPPLEAPMTPPPVPIASDISSSGREPLSSRQDTGSASNVGRFNTIGGDSGAPAAPAKPLTMMERQALWMAKKKEALDQQRKEKEEKEIESLKFKPNTDQSKRTFKIVEKADPRPSDKATSKGRQTAPEPKAAPKAVPRSGAAPRSSGPPQGKAIPTTASSKWQAVKLKVKSGTVGAGKKKTNPGAKKAAPKAAPRVREAAEITQEAGGKAVAGVEDQGEGNGNDEANPEVKPEIDEEEVEEEEEEEKEEEAVYVPGEFWWRIDEGRGQHRVNDGGLFQMLSIYRKRDKTRDVSGISLLVGRLDAPPCSEKVIQVMFDTKEWTEEGAFQWWQKNGYRYTGEACPDTGKLVVENKPVPLGNMKKAFDPVAKEWVEQKKPFDALDPSFTPDAQKDPAVSV